MKNQNIILAIVRLIKKNIDRINYHIYIHGQLVLQAKHKV